ncbi:MAG: LamG domain-containing protein, partial [Acidobacteria bacterium]|nr:LamG domain-containing protein [Acidobacteriota bacterium]
MKAQLLGIARLIFGIAVLGTGALAGDSGLVGYWLLDEGTGQTIDECSGLSLAGKIVGDANWEQTEKGMTLKFDGKRTAVRIPESSSWIIGSGELTFCMWVKMEKEGQGFMLDHSFGGTPGAWCFQRTGPLPRIPYFCFYDDKKTPMEMNFSGFEFGKWEHLTLVWHKSVDGWVKGYLNGEVVGSATNISCTGLLPPNYLYVGARQGSADFFNGSIRDLAIFNRALSDNEVATIYKNGVPSPSPVVI